MSLFIMPLSGVSAWAKHRVDVNILKIVGVAPCTANQTALFHCVFELVELLFC